MVSSILHLGILIFLLKTYIPGFDKKSQGSTYQVNKVTGLDKSTDQEIEILNIDTLDLLTEPEPVEQQKFPIRLDDLVQNKPEVESSKKKLAPKKIKLSKNSVRKDIKKGIKPSQDTSNTAFEPAGDKNLWSNKAAQQHQDIIDTEPRFSDSLDAMENLIDEPVDIAHLNQPKVEIPKQLSKKEEGRG